MHIRPMTLALIVTYRCTASCDHCCFHCSPRSSGTVPFRRLLALIDEAAAVGTLQAVVFTGGEPFLLGESLKQLIAYAAEHGFVTRCVSNGYWAKTEAIAQKRVEELAAAGLKELNLSTGTFHSRYVPLKRVINAMCAASDAGLAVFVTVETFEGSEISPNTLLADPRVSQRVAAGRLVIGRNVWIDNHGPWPVTHSPEHRRFREPNKTPCETVLRTIAVTPDMKLLACCGLHAVRIPDLILGDLSKGSLREVLDGAPDDLLKMWLAVDGPERIAEFLAEHEPAVRFPKSAVHPCETCRWLYTDPLARRLLVQHHRKVEQRVVERFTYSLALVELERQRLRARVQGLARTEGF